MKSRTIGVSPSARAYVIALIILSFVAGGYLLIQYRQAQVNRMRAVAALAKDIPGYLGMAESYLESTLAGGFKSYTLLSRADPYLLAAANGTRLLQDLDKEHERVWLDVRAALDDARAVISFDKLGLPPDWDSLTPQASSRLKAVSDLVAEIKKAFPDEVSTGQGRVTFDLTRLRDADDAALRFLDLEPDEEPLVVGPGSPPFLDVASKIMALRLEDHGTFEITDVRAVALLRDILVQAEEVPQPKDQSIRHTQSVSLRVGVEWIAPACQFAYDDLPEGNPSYVQWGGKWYEVPADFRAMLAASRLHKPATYSVDAADLEFLDSDGWTPFFLMSATTVDLPAEFIHRPGEFPEVIYWAWNNELGKDVGLDLTPYLGKTVEARLYKTVKMLPESTGPNRDDGRAVVVRSEGKIIGAWLSLGRHWPFACSLEGRTLEDLTGKTPDEWVTALIDRDNPLEQELAAKTPEEILETYYSSIDRKDYAMAHACEARSKLLGYLASNMDVDRLYNDGFGESEGRGLGNFISVKFLGAERAEEFERTEYYSARGLRCYYVSVDQHRKVLAGNSDGQSGYFVTMVQETPETGWRIESIGTGP